MKQWRDEIKKEEQAEPPALSEKKTRLSLNLDGPEGRFHSVLPTATQKTANEVSRCETCS